MEEVFGPTAVSVIEGEKGWKKNGAEKHLSRLNNLLSRWDEVVKAMLKVSYAEAKRLLGENREALDEIAAFLIETVSGPVTFMIFAGDSA